MFFLPRLSEEVWRSNSGNFCRMYRTIDLLLSCVVLKFPCMSANSLLRNYHYFTIYDSLRHWPQKGSAASKWFLLHSVVHAHLWLFENTVLNAAQCGTFFLGRSKDKTFLKRSLSKNVAGNVTSEKEDSCRSHSVHLGTCYIAGYDRDMIQSLMRQTQKKNNASKVHGKYCWDLTIYWAICNSFRDKSFIIKVKK